MDQQELIPHLFRTEYTKITAVLSRHFGLEHIEIAEDIASDTFLAASETWAIKGVPENPTAWLYTVAKNKARNYLNRNTVFQQKITPEVRQSTPVTQHPDIDLSEQNITDSQLQMIFAVCHPAISAEAQVALALRILCGFGIEEIARAFLTNTETINKRLFRAKEKLQTGNIRLEFPEQNEVNNRLDTVLTTLYLLFNEGYYSANEDVTLRRELCLEAMRLTHMLSENEQTSRPTVNALLALMCFHASRFDARIDAKGEIVLYEDQDTSLWNRELIVRGEFYLNMASRGSVLSKYHLEAGIAYWHTLKDDTADKWQNILHLYNQLLQVEYSPIAALNRTFAISKVRGNPAAIAEAEKLDLSGNHLYHSLLGELYRESDHDKALSHLQSALRLAKSTADQAIISKKIELLLMVHKSKE